MNFIPLPPGIDILRLRVFLYSCPSLQVFPSNVECGYPVPDHALHETRQNSLVAGQSLTKYPEIGIFRLVIEDTDIRTGPAFALS